MTSLPSVPPARQQPTAACQPRSTEAGGPVLVIPGGPCCEQDFGGAATLIAAAGTGAASTTALAAGGSPTAPHQLQDLFTLSDLDFETLFAFGSAGYGCAEFGELGTAVNQVNTAGASYQTYYDGFFALALRTEALAADERAAGHTASGSAYLRASTYYDMCLYFILGTAARARRPTRTRLQSAAGREPAIVRPAVRAGPHTL